MPHPSAAAVIEDAIQHPDRYVLKPQREGGGNNFYGEEMAARLQEARAAGGGLGAYILMQVGCCSPWVPTPSCWRVAAMRCNVRLRAAARSCALLRAAACCCASGLCLWCGRGGDESLRGLPCCQEPSEVPLHEWGLTSRPPASPPPPPSAPVPRSASCRRRSGR